LVCVNKYNLHFKCQPLYFVTFDKRADLGNRRVDFGNKCAG
jgi:hypothetical protein